MTTTKADAQGRADDIRAFGRELARLREEGLAVLSAPQADAVQAHHAGVLEALAHGFDIDRDERTRQLSLGMRIASFLGALALAAALFFLFRQFWGLLSTPLQVGLLLVAALGSLAACELIGRHDPSGHFRKLAAFVAFACFVLDIALLGQVFNITPSDKALLPWAAFAFLLAYRFDSRLLLVAGLTCISAFIAARAGTWSGIYWLSFGQRPENFLPAAIVLFCVPMLIDHRRFAGFPATWRVFALLNLFLPALVLANWGAGSYLAWPVARIEALYQILGFAGSAAVIALGVRRGWNDVVNTGVVFFVVFLYTKFYDWWWEWMPKSAFFLLIAFSAILLLVVFTRLRRVAMRADHGGAGR